MTNVEGDAEDQPPPTARGDLSVQKVGDGVAGAADRDPDQIKTYTERWKFCHVFRQGNEPDDNFVKELREMNALPKLHEGHRLSP